MYAKALEFYGFSTLQAEDGAVGVRVAQAENPDIILMDIAMPVLDAWGAIRLLKDSPETAEIPVIALTAPPPPVVGGGRQRPASPASLPKPANHGEAPQRSDAAAALATPTDRAAASR